MAPKKDKEFSVTPTIAKHLERFKPDLRDIELLPNQNGPDVKEMKTNFYANTTRSIFCALGWPDTCAKTAPLSDSTWTYKNIPSLPELDDESSAQRAKDIETLHAYVQRWYGCQRRAENSEGRSGAAGGSSRLALQKRHIERIFASLAPAPSPVRALDLYQREHSERYKDAFATYWQDRLNALDDDVAKKELHKCRAGEECRFASQSLSHEPKDFVGQLEASARGKYDDAMERYKSLFGNPDQTMANSCAWVAPEMGSFLQLLVDWLCLRYGVAITLLVAGQHDTGRGDCQTIFGSGARRAGSSTLLDFMGITLRDAKIQMRMYAQDVLTGEVADGIEEKAKDGKGADDASDDEEDLTGPMFEAGGSRTMNTAPAGVPPVQCERGRGHSRAPHQPSRSISSSPLGHGLEMDTFSSRRDDQLSAPGALRKGADARSGAGGDDRDARAKGAGQDSRPRPPILDPLGGLARYGGSCDGSQAPGSYMGSQSREQDRGAGGNRHGGGSSLEPFGSQLGSRPVMPNQRITAETARALPGLAAGDRTKYPFAAADPTEDEEELALPTTDWMWPAELDARTRPALEDDAGSFGGGRPRLASQSRSTVGSSSGVSRGSRMSMPAETDDEGIDADTLHKSIYKDRKQKNPAPKKPREGYHSKRRRAENAVGDAAGSGGAAGSTAPVGDAQTAEGTQGAGSARVGRDTDLEEWYAEKRKKTAQSKPRPKRLPGRVARTTATLADAPGRPTRVEPSRGKAALAGTAVSASGTSTTATDVVETAPLPRRRQRQSLSGSSLQQLTQPKPARKKPRAVLDSDEEQNDESNPVTGNDDSVMQAIDEHNVPDILAFENDWAKRHSGASYASVTGAAWDAYAREKRAVVVNAIHALGGADDKRAYADVVEKMEALLAHESSWDPAGSKQLPNARRPSGVGAMVKARGALVAATELSASFGRDFVRWWIALQPSERAPATAASVADLLPAGSNMDWATFTQARGYKGAFLLVWCLAHWAMHDDDRQQFAAAARDISTVLGILAVLSDSGQQLRESGQLAGDTREGLGARASQRHVR
ncbi:unnamed protein product [Peniophora sp. CBMAI 1063]|nr:unnamed protein product [Peniophora sp. CBMAI 1063]